MGGEPGAGGGVIDKVVRTLRVIGTYIPTVCGGGTFNYNGIHLSSGVAGTGVSKIRVADTRDGYSEAYLAEFGGGEFFTGGYGQIIDVNSASTPNEHIIFLGLGEDAIVEHVNLSGFIAKAGKKKSFGFVGEASGFGVQGGVGYYTNIDNLTSCVDHGGR